MSETAEITTPNKPLLALEAAEQALRITVYRIEAEGADLYRHLPDAGEQVMAHCPLRLTYSAGAPITAVSWDLLLALYDVPAYIRRRVLMEIAACVEYARESAWREGADQQRSDTCRAVRQIFGLDEAIGRMDRACAELREAMEGDR